MEGDSHHINKKDIMKKESRITTIINSLLSAVLAMLGFSACSDSEGEEIPDMYGTPYGHFQISGEVKDEDSKAVEGAMVISRQFKYTDFCADKDANNYYLSQGCDTAYTDRKGRYDLKAYSYLAGNEVEVVVEDHSGQYEDAFRLVELNYPDGNFWNHGTAKAEVNFTLKKSEDKK